LRPVTWVNTADYDARRIVGALLRDVPPLLAQLATKGGWLKARNRFDRLSADPMGPGLRCEFEWSSVLHACKVFPPLATWLMRRAFQQWPIVMDAPVRPAAGEPQLSFLIPFRGTARLPQLQAVVRSILAQQGVSVECIVIEQSNVSEVGRALPEQVRYVHLPHPNGDPAWRKSWAYNEAGRLARGQVLVCHDGDILVPGAYGRELLAAFARGFDSVHIQRFLFYLCQADTDRLLQGGRLADCVPLEVLQNWEGGTLAIRREAFMQVGGYDERFVDWGGEDNEFFDRCKALRQHRFGLLPFVHLWHPPQPSKTGPGREAALALMHERLALPRVHRMNELSRKLAQAGVA
jgi:hypothetical protein